MLFTIKFCLPTSTKLVVSGDANFTIPRAGLTLGGFLQPSMARAFIEQQSNVETGLCQHFLWIVPNPKVVSFEFTVDASFTTTAIGELYDYTNLLLLWSKVHALPSA